MGGQTLDAKSVGGEIGEGNSITTLNGKAEILLTPGVFLRLGPNTSARLIAAKLTDIQVQLDQGDAMIDDKSSGWGAALIPHSRQNATHTMAY